MAHLLVYVQRTEGGIHPASAVAMCIARELASSKGATLLALCVGRDANPDAEAQIMRQSGRYGADRIHFANAKSIISQVRRIDPILSLAPHTAEGLEFLAQIKTNQRIAHHWQHLPYELPMHLPRLMSVVAGTPPWNNFSTQLTASYEEGLEEIASFSSQSENTAAPQQYCYYSATPLSAKIRDLLKPFSASEVTLEDFAQVQRARLFYFQAPDATFEIEALKLRSPGSQVFLLIDREPTTTVESDWTWADWVIPGPWDKTLAAFHNEMWQLILM